MAEATTNHDASDADSDAEWLARLDEIGEAAGYFEPLGKDHWAFFVDESPTLIVTFETIDDIRGGADDQMPLGHHVARERGWSHLCLIAGRETWYRDPRVYGYFDRLVDDAFFEDFDRVVFYGAGMCGYAAAAFSATAPGATVLLCAPQATLDPELAGWDPRFRAHRRLDFTHRYGFAPDMTEGAGKVFALHDPEEPLDAMHAALFHRPHVVSLRARGVGPRPAHMLHQMGLLTDLLTLAGSGNLTAGTFFRRFRARHSHLVYLHWLLARADRRQRPLLSALICRAVLRVHNAPRFRRRLSALEEELDAMGVALPAPRPTV